MEAELRDVEGPTWIERPKGTDVRDVEGPAASAFNRLVLLLASDASRDGVAVAMPGRNDGYFGLFHILANKFDKAKP